MLGAILIAWILTYLIPSGSYARTFDADTGRSTVVAGSYAPEEAEAPGLLELLRSVPEGLISRADLIVLILLIGGSFYIVEKSGALGDGLHLLVRLLAGKESLALVVVSLLFMVAGMTIGLQEEIIAMAPVLIVFSRSLGYNDFTALGQSYGSAVLGAAFSPMNPFAVIVAQNEAELPLMSGTPFRLAILAAAFILWNLYMVRYAKRNRVPLEAISGTNGSMSARSAVILGLLCLTFCLVTYGLIVWGWGFNELSACFFAMGLLVGLIGKMGLNGTGEAFSEGFREMIFAGVIIGLAGSITLLLEQGKVIDTIVYGMFTPMEGLPAGLSALGMFVGQAVLHMPVPSYSGQAILTMPILTPLSDLAGVSRQVCVLAYQYGAVNMDMVFPTNGALMGILAVAGIPYNKWFRFIWRPALLLMALAAAAILLAVYTGF